MQSNACFLLFCFVSSKKTGISHKATKFSNSKATFFHVKVYIFLTGGDGVDGVFCNATIPMACFGVKTAKKACRLKGWVFFKSISAFMEKGREEATWLWWKGFTNLVDNKCNSWQRYTSSGSLGTSLCWHITVHENTRDSPYFTNKLLYSRTYIYIKKQEFVRLWEKSHVYWGQLPFIFWLIWILWQTRSSWPHSTAGQMCTLSVGKDRRLWTFLIQSYGLQS